MHVRVSMLPCPLFFSFLLYVYSLGPSLPQQLSLLALSLNLMLRLPRHSSTRVVRALRERAALGTTVSPGRPCSIWRRDLASSPPHDNTPPPLVPRSALSSADSHHRSVLVPGRLHTNRRRTAADAREGPGLLARPQAAASVTQPQRRGLASAGKGKGGKDGGGGGGGGEEEGMFGRLKKTFEEEIEKVRASQQAHGRTAVAATFPS